jgi:hypothetical protein
LQVVAGPVRWAMARRKTVLFLAGLAAVLLGLYWTAASAQGVFFVGDIFRLGYPARSVYAQALREGRIPLWTPDALAGYPLLAEGQTGAYYPLNLLLYRLLPLPKALNYSVLSALWLAGAGTFAYARLLGLRHWPAFLAGCVFMLGGFVPGHLNHLNMLAAVAWLPLLLWAVERGTRSGGWRRWGVAAAVFGLQGLAGHPQVSLLSALLALAQAAAGPLAGGARFSWRRQAGQTAACGLALLAGGVLAMVQWAPTLELTRLSQRSHGLDSEFFTSFSLHPLQWVSMLWPFVRGNPYPLTSLETIGYAGALPLLLAALVPLWRRDRLVAFWVGVVALAFFLTLGRWNPAYRWLVRVPVLNLFRAPARYLLWADLGIAVLAAASFDTLLARTRRMGSWLWQPAGGLLFVGACGAWIVQAELEGLVEAWRWLPLLWLGLGLLLLVAASRRPPRTLWAGLVVGLVLADLAAFNAVYNRTYNATMALDDFQRVPDALRFLQADAGEAPYRIYTHEAIVPVLPVMRESLYPNIQLLHGVESLNGYYPLVPEGQQWLVEHLSPRLADLLNVRYVLIPQLLPVDEETEAYDTGNPFSPSLAGRRFEIPAQGVAALEVEGYLSHSADLDDGTPVGEVVLRGAGGEEAVWVLRAGDDLAEWAYDRDDVQEIVRHSRPAETVRLWPAQSGFPPREHTGRTYLARHTLPRPIEVREVEVRAFIPRAYLQLERLRLIDEAGGARLLSELVGEGDHVLVYRSADVAIYRNERAGPRAFLVHRTQVVSSRAEAEALTLAPSFEPWREAVLEGGRELSGRPQAGDGVQVELYEAERVRLRVKTGEEGYLVLADSNYPGWVAWVDGRPVPIERADVVLRAVAVPPGEHVVEFCFAPLSWRLGLAASALGWLALAVAALGRRMRTVVAGRGVWPCGIMQRSRESAAAEVLSEERGGGDERV